MAAPNSSRPELSPPPARMLPELLAPAGDWECAKAAVENGADAIYFGLEKFNARMRANNFTVADLPRLMEFLHHRGVKGYVTFNTLVFENELADAANYLRSIIAAGVDAAIVQDVGIARLIRTLSPDFPIHASTQMTITSAAGVAFARELGCNLVVLARECSLKEIAKIHASGEAAKAESTAPASTAAVSSFESPPATLPLEIFVHGALCVAYSGQCLTSEALGGRSANRGECAQACRMPYELISDGKQVPLGDRRYLLSPQDLSGLEVLPEIINAGVASLKIEGRLKSPEYVANITRVYRAALDKFDASRRLTETPGQEFSSASSAPPTRSSAGDRYDVEMAFSRGLFTGWLGGNDNQHLVHARFGKKRGVFLGEVTRVSDDRIALKLRGPLKPGDGVVFDAGAPDQEEEGGFVYQVIPRGEETWIGFGHGDVNFRRVHVGDKLWKTSDPELDKRLRQSFEGEKVRYQRPLHLEVHGFPGKPLTLVARDEEGHIARLESAVALVAAEKQPLTTDRLREQLGRLGGTPFKLGEMRNELSGEVMLPVSELNRLRREAVAEVERQRRAPKRWKTNEINYDHTNPHGKANATPASPAHGAAAAELIVLVRNLAQLDAALKCGVRTIYCDFEDPKKYREAVTTFHQAFGCSTLPATAGTAAPSIWVAPPRIFKTGEEWTLEQVRSSNADGYLVRNYDHLKYFSKDRRIGDFALNVANRFAAEYFKQHFALERVTVSYDLNFQQLEALLQAAPPQWFDITIHQHMPMFHMEHCVFCAFLSSGKDYHDCGRPCDRHTVQLRDRVGMEHPLKADVGCRNTVFHAQAQTGAEYVERMLALGVRNFRVEFVNETPALVAQTVAKYRQLLRGEISGTELWRELKLHNQLGVTRGQMAGKRG